MHLGTSIEQGASYLNYVDIENEGHFLPSDELNTFPFHFRISLTNGTFPKRAQLSQCTTNQLLNQRVESKCNVAVY